MSPAVKTTRIPQTRWLAVVLFVSWLIGLVRTKMLGRCTTIVVEAEDEKEMIRTPR